MRHDLGMRRGKQIAQGAHASLLMVMSGEIPEKTIQDWTNNGMPKICVRVNSEEELFEIRDKALENKLCYCLVVDEGRTEFNGVKTPTCLAIGPEESESIDQVTGSLKLL